MVLAIYSFSVENNNINSHFSKFESSGRRIPAVNSAHTRSLMRLGANYRGGEREERGRGEERCITRIESAAQ